MSVKVNDAYTVLLREKKLPLQLLEDPEKKVRGVINDRLIFVRHITSHGAVFGLRMQQVCQ